MAKTSNINLSPVGQIKKRLSVYELWNQNMMNISTQKLNFCAGTTKSLCNPLFFGPLISGTFLAQDISDGIAFYRDKNQLKSANGLTFGGALTAGAGSATGLLATTWYYLDETFNQRKLQREGKLPEQLLLKRLKTLDEVETIISE